MPGEFNAQMDLGFFSYDAMVHLLHKTGISIMEEQTFFCDGLSSFIKRRRFT